MCLFNSHNILWGSQQMKSSLSRLFAQWQSMRSDFCRYCSWQWNTAGCSWYISTLWNNGKTSHLQPWCFLDTPPSPRNTSRAQSSSLTPASTCHLFTALSKEQQAVSAVPVCSSPSIWHSKQCWTPDPHKPWAFHPCYSLARSKCTSQRNFSCPYPVFSNHTVRI